MEIKNNLNPMFHMSVDKGDGTRDRASYALTEQSYESIQEMARVFEKVHEHCPNLAMWFTLVTTKEHTDNEV